MKVKSREEYRSTIAYRFFDWLSGRKDPYIDNVEIHPQVAKELTVAELLVLEHEKELARERAYDKEHNKFLAFYNKLYKVFAATFCVVLIYILLLTVSYLPATGTVDRPVNNEVANRYLENGMEETGATNLVSGMILSYRAFDTFGETNVLFIATCCVMIMLMLEEKEVKRQDAFSERKFEPRDDIILEAAAYVLCPVIMIFGIYIIFNGHLSPGGGFAGGAVIGSGIILYEAAFGFAKTGRFFNEHIYRICKVSALIAYGLIGAYYYITGANGIANHIPLGIPGNILSGGIILPINIAVGIEVACTMYAFYALFRRGGL